MHCQSCICYSQLKTETKISNCYIEPVPEKRDIIESVASRAMDFFSSSWPIQPTHLPVSHPSSNDASISTEDWAKATSSSSNQPLTSHPPSSLDYPDAFTFDGGEQLPPRTESSSYSLPTATPSPSTANPFWFATGPYPFNSSSPPFQNQFPYQISSYSSLNGATGSTPTPPQQQLQPQQHTPFAIESVIVPQDSSRQTTNVPHSPALVSNLSSSSTPLNAYHQSPISQYPAGLIPNHSPPHAQQQRTMSLNPQLLHSNLPQSAAPSDFSNHIPPTLPVPIPSNIKHSIDYLVTSGGLTGGAPALAQLIKDLKAHGPSDIDPEILTDFMSKVSMRADDQFLKAWADSEEAMEILRDWLKFGAVKKDDGRWVQTINPILAVRTNLLCQ